MTSYVGVHIDGVLECRTMQVGLLKAIPNTPLVRVHIAAGLQKHPVWALDRLAVVIYAYVQMALRHENETVQINAHGTLVSSDSFSCVVMRSITWHTSHVVRADAERMIGEMTAPNGIPWPRSAEMTLPVEASLVESLHTVWSRYAG